ncbi:hypothetical protein [Niastella populi]|uniref:Uncharacterized protein n=1 Tax=Niastella populi TaxID=550983 RepID=A0A1V9ENK2_9BACT|nr:hypothetical protein [Niastella populi]OQP47728.1 hypothetical protein A4R26_31865 [Niastella populi]
MALTLTYQPDKGVFIDNKLLLWSSDRQQVRTLLNGKFEIADNVIDLGDATQSLIQRRDIYESYQGLDNFFFLNFDENEQLTEVEVHYGLTINVAGVIIDFSMDIEKAADLLCGISADKKQLSDGEYFFKNLKLTIASSDSMGGEGNDLSYFYCSKDVSHLVDKEVCS